MKLLSVGCVKNKIRQGRDMKVFRITIGVYLLTASGRLRSRNESDRTVSQPVAHLSRFSPT